MHRQQKETTTHARNIKNGKKHSPDKDNQSSNLRTNVFDTQNNKYMGNKVSRLEAQSLAAHRTRLSPSAKHLWEAPDGNDFQDDVSRDKRQDG